MYVSINDGIPSQVFTMLPEAGKGPGDQIGDANGPITVTNLAL